MRIRNRQDFWSGAMFIGIGFGFAFQASGYNMGTASQMGPGYFPFIIGALLAAMGSVVLLTSLSNRASKTAVTRFDRRAMFLITVSVVLYGLFLQLLGLYVSTFLLVVIGSYAGHEFRWKVSIATAILLMLFSYFTFIRGLGLILPLWPSFLSYT